MIRCESGFFLAREIRALPELGQCRLVAMTGFAREQHRQTSEAAGFHEHLNKPIDVSRLFEAIEAPRSRLAR
jgi:CheY-like chemotaxis protein